MTTFVLVPGAGGAAWYWHRVVPLLIGAGHEAVALDLPADDPASGLPEYARLVSDAVGVRSAAGAGGWPAEFDLATHFTHDVSPAVLASGAEHQRDETDAAFAAPCDFTEWPAITIRVVAGRDDRFFPVAFQQCVARKRLGIEPDVLPRGHLMALSRPVELADYLVAV